MGFYGLLIVAAIITVALVSRMNSNMHPAESELASQINLYKGIVGAEIWSVGIMHSANTVNMTKIADIDGMDLTESHGILTVSDSFYPKVYKSYI